MDTENRDTDREELSQNQNDDNREITIKLDRHGDFYKLLQDPAQLRRLFLFILWILMSVMVGLAVILLVIKTYYPYSSISTTLNGATTIKTEEGEVNYWLFNTAELWANSGIKVEKGDILTIRASGASNTAVHHISNDARKNLINRKPWVGTSGKKNTSGSQRNGFRNQFRIAPFDEEGVLLMQVFPEEHVKSNDEYTAHDTTLLSMFDGSTSSDRIYVIGQERQNLVIRQDGVLHFTVNDIVLTPRNIDKMQALNLKTIFGDDYLTVAKPIKDIVDRELTKAMPCDSASEATFHRFVREFADKTLSKFAYESDSSLRTRSKKSFSLSRYTPLRNDIPDNPFINELDYYKLHNFYDAWYVDNVGSFLIVVERKHKSDK